MPQYSNREEALKNRVEMLIAACKDVRDSIEARMENADAWNTGHLIKLNYLQNRLNDLEFHLRTEILK